MLSFINSNKKIFTILFFLLLLFIGTSIFKDYGISIDEDNTRVNGFVTLKYLLEFFAPEQVLKLNEIVNLSDLNIRSTKTVEESSGTQGLGVIFDLPMALVEFVFKINDSRDYFLLRHFFNFMLFFVSICFFFLIAKNRYNSYLMGIIGVFLLLTSPRIFAESFYNNKDLVFMSLFIISLYTGINFINNPNSKNLIYFSLASALSINIRILGLLLPSLIIFFFFIFMLRENKLKKYHPKYIVLHILLLSFFTIIFWPFLWHDTLENFIKVFKSLSDYDFTVYTLYLGEYINSKYLPWHYPLIWISISTPLLHLVLFLIGLIFIVQRLIKRLIRIENNNSYTDLWRGNSEFQDLLFLSILLMPLILVIGINSTLYDGWRHLYFIYPGFIMICLFALNSIRIFLVRKKNNILIFIIPFLLLSLPTTYWMYKNHPHQNIYFNYFAGKNFNKNFDMDYWGLSNHKALMHIVNNESKKVTVGSIGTNDLHLSRKFLDKKYKNKISITNDLENSDYLINNYRDWYGKIYDFDSEIPSNFMLFYSIKVDDIAINTIYKKIE